MKIESSDRTIEQLLAMGYFRIPRFQRPYSWERAEVEEFWNDTIVDAESCLPTKSSRPISERSWHLRNSQRESLWRLTSSEEWAGNSVT